MEEARQHPSLRSLARLFVMIWTIGLIAIIIGIAGQMLFGGLWVQECLAGFLCSRFVLECVRLKIASLQGATKLGFQRANVFLHLIIALGGTYALNAVAIERYFK